METASPTNEVPWPIQSRKKRALLRRESFVESIPNLGNETHPWPLSNAPPGTGPLLRLTDGAVTRLQLDSVKDATSPASRVRLNQPEAVSPRHHDQGVGPPSVP